MMARIDAHEIEDITGYLESLGASWKSAAKQGLYEGRAVLKKAVEDEINGMHTVTDRYYWGKMQPLYALRETERQGLKDGLRIYKMEDTKNGVQVALGFEGVNENGVANALVARSLVKGTSVQKPNKFTRRAFDGSIKKATDAVISKIYSVTGKFKTYYKKKG